MQARPRRVKATSRPAVTPAALEVGGPGCIIGTAADVVPASVIAIAGPRPRPTSPGGIPSTGRREGEPRSSSGEGTGGAFAPHGPRASVEGASGPMAASSAPYCIVSPAQRVAFALRTGTAPQAGAAYEGRKKALNVASVIILAP